MARPAARCGRAAACALALAGTALIACGQEIGEAVEGPDVVGALVEGDGAPPPGGGLTLEVHNALPITRDPHGEVISKVFIACALEVGVGPSGGAPRRQTLPLSGPVLAGASRRFHLSAAALAGLRPGGGGQGWLRICDSLNLGGRGALCDVPLRLPAADDPGPRRITVRVRARLNDHFDCAVEPISAVGPGRA